MPLKIVQSTGWTALATATLPFLTISHKPFVFFTKKIIKVWSQNTTETTIKVDKVDPNVSLSKSSCETILKTWVEKDPRGEDRITAQEKIRALLGLSGFQRKETLDLKNLNLTSLPDIFNNPCFHQLKHLDLSCNQLTTLPESFGNLQALTYLDLTNNQLTTLPASFRKLQALTNLYLERNQLTALPKSFRELQALTNLYLERNQLTALPKSFRELQALTCLDLSNNQLTTLPAFFGELQALTKLCLSRNLLTALPASFGNLQALTQLYLSSNQLTTLPASFGNLQALTYLDLYNNLLTALPASFGNLQALTYLCLTNNQLTTLPASFGNLQALTYLYLTNNQLTTLPASFGNLQVLTNLYLTNNQLTTLPASFGNLQALTYLDLYNNLLTALPASFGNLQALTYLYLTNNQLTTLPASFGNLQALTYLYLTNNQLTTLPASFGNLQVLTNLYLTNNQLTTLPASFGNLQALTYLYLTNNQLTTLPASFGNLQVLTNLYLERNATLSGIPMSILALSSQCIIDLTQCNLSMAILERLRARTETSNYSGPRINYSIADIADTDLNEEKSIEESLKSLYAIIDKTPTKFAKLEETPELSSWLHRLSYTADYKAGREMKKALAKKIISYLNQADTDTEFRTIFYQVIQDASETCGDRVALSVLHLSIAYQLATIDCKDMKQLANFLIKGPWTIEMLESIAYNKIRTLPFFDEIEVYLGYLIKLKKDLDLPIDVQEMLYFTCSALQEKDLKEAKDFILEKQKNQNERFKFLISHSKWQEALSANYREEYQAILDGREEAAEQEVPDYISIEKTYKQELTALTRKALESEKLDLCIG
ncbi:leucine-rich repeat domain-containing protein [Candidatus Rhabdochlamydia oedothoracis]|nr:leucine-rich repeat domain-containing protein [Candidatus Rhabdochlamydia oedothoracis]